MSLQKSWNLLILLGMPFTLQLLGIPQVQVNHNPVLITPNNPSLLLLYLAHRGEWVSRSELAFLFRPDDDETTAKEHVRLLLHRAKQLPWAKPLETTRQQARFVIDCDLHHFKKAVAEKDWEKAISVYTGPFLGDLSIADAPTYTAWLELERSDLKGAYQNALMHQAKHLEAREDHNTAAEVLNTLLKQDNLDEEVFQWFLRVTYLAGEREKALKAYEDFCLLLHK